MRIALLGSGILMQQLAKSTLDAGHEIIAVGTNVGADLSCWQLDTFDIKPVIIEDYRKICDMPVDAVLMFSYMPLIKEDYLAKKKFINIHYALLPRYRGFHGFIWSMINDEEKMGYTVHLVDQGIDSGPVYFQHAVDSNDNMNINDVRHLLDKHLVDNIGNYLTEIENGKEHIAQVDSKAIYVTKRSPEDGLIDWNWSARLVFNHIRALTPPATPGAYSYYKGQKIVFTQAEWFENESYFAKSGEVVYINYEGYVLVKCGDGVLKINEIQVNGQTMMPGAMIKIVGGQFRTEL